MRIGIDSYMLVQDVYRQLSDRSEVRIVVDTGVGNNDVESADVMLRLEALDDRGSVGGYGAVKLHRDESTTVAFGDLGKRLGSGVGGVTDGSDHSIIGA